MKGEEKSMGRPDTARDDELVQFEFDDLKLEDDPVDSSEDDVIDLVEIVEEGVIPPKVEGAYEKEPLLEKDEEEDEIAGLGDSEGEEAKGELGDSEDQLELDVGLSDSLDQQATQSLDLDLESVPTKSVPEETMELGAEEQGEAEDLVLDLEDLEDSEEPEGAEDLEELDSLELEEDLELEDSEDSAETLLEETEVGEAELEEEGPSEALLDEVERELPEVEVEEAPQAIPLTEEKVEEIVTRVVGDVVERVVRQSVAEAAEKVIREAIEALKASLEEVKGQ